MGAMNLGLVVSTLGRAEPLERLLRSLAPQVGPDDRIVLVAQDNRDQVERLAARFRGADVAIDVTTSERGASRGRNAGVAALPAGERLLHFPNDTTWFPDGSVAAIRAASGSVAAGALTVVDEHGPKFTLPASGTPLDRWNVWSVIEMGLLMRRSVFDEVGGFDQGYIGAEDHEFSLRLAQHGIPIHFAPDARIAYRYRSEASVLWRQGNTYGRSRPRLRRRVVEAGLPAPSRFAGWRSWLWLLRHLPGLGSPEGRARWAWVAGNRVGQLRGSVEARSVFV
jgi:GT2 family glycosyltransferase